MKLLFDENLSPKLVERLAAEYPGSAHVVHVGLRGESDRRIWDYAVQHGFMIVSKDDDFRQRSFLQGAPPKVLWLQVGNAGTSEIVDLLRERVHRIREFDGEDESALLILSAARED